MNASHLLVWFDDGQPRACELAKVPDVFVYKGKFFRAETEYFGDVDYLRDEQNRLVGFAYYSAGKWKDIIWKKLLSQSKNVKLDDGILVILLKSCSYEIKSVVAMGTEVYRSPTNEIILAVPNWDFGTLGFELTNTNAPVECNATVNKPS
jgi:hypothetical protein